MRKSTIVAVFCGGLCLLAASPASSQSVRQLDAARPPGGRQYYATYSNPTVSPYVNLGVNANGISNYQTFVRPLIEERKAIEQQSEAIERLNQRLNPAAARRGRRDVEGPAARRQPAVRFMDYSHYFGPIR